MPRVRSRSSRSTKPTISLRRSTAPPGPTRSSSSTLAARDDTRRHRPRAGAFASKSRAWTGYVDQKNFAASLASNDWIFSLDADERVTPELALGDPQRAVYRATARRRIGSRGSRHHLGRWIRTTDFYPDYQTRLYDRRSARWQGRTCTSRSASTGPSGQLRDELQHYSYRDLSDHLDRINHYTTLAARQMYESGRRASASICWCIRRRRSCGTTSCAEGSSTAPSV